MSFHKSIENLIDRYGSKISIECDSEVKHTKAFIQPLRYRDRATKIPQINIGGLIDGRFYLYIGKGNCEFSRAKNTIITSSGRKYVVHTSELFELHNKALYVWAVLAPYKEQRRDDYDTDT